MDIIDRKILHELQRDATLPVAQLAERVGLSQTPCWKRLQRLEQTGVITGRVAIVAPEKLGLALTVFVEVEAADHSPEWRDKFFSIAEQSPEVMEIYRMAGDVDYLLRVVVTDMKAYDAFYRALTDRITLKNVTSHFAMERLKATTAYPVDTHNR